MTHPPWRAQGEVLLGDLTVALARLGSPAEAPAPPGACGTLTHDEIDHIAALLGLRLAPPTPPRPPPPPPAPPPTPPPSPPSPPVASPPSAVQVALGLRIEPLPPRPLPALPSGATLPTEAGPLRAPPPPPLLEPRWARGVLGGALGTWEAEGDLDAPRAVEQLLRRQVTTLPRLPLRALRRGCEVLVDRGPGMAAFAADVDLLLGDLDRTLGPGRWSARLFDAERGGVYDPETGRRQPFRPSERGRPVLVLSDLGIGSGQRRPWLELADVAARHGCPLVALVPWPRQAWPADLRRRYHLVVWDRPTTALQARRRRPR